MEIPSPESVPHPESVAGQLDGTGGGIATRLKIDAPSTIPRRSWLQRIKDSERLKEVTFHGVRAAVPFMCIASGELWNNFLGWTESQSMGDFPHVDYYASHPLALAVRIGAITTATVITWKIGDRIVKSSKKNA